MKQLIAELNDYEIEPLKEGIILGFYVEGYYLYICYRDYSYDIKKNLENEKEIVVPVTDEDINTLIQHKDKGVLFTKGTIEVLIKKKTVKEQGEVENGKGKN